MENSIKFIRVPLIINGFDLFNKDQPVRNTILRAVIYLSIIWLPLTSVSATALSNNIKFVDGIFLALSFQANITVTVLSVHFWQFHHKIFEIFDEITNLHKVREEEWFQSHSHITFAKCSTFVNAFSK